MNSEVIDSPRRDACEQPKQAIPFFIDQQRFVTDQPKQTPHSLLKYFAGEKPEETTLARKVPGHEPHKYTNPDEEIILTADVRFVVYYNTPCTVS